ncbi:MAG TPA: hypothetical protein VMJ75_06530 [Candidatus Acidoferrales bacterium]|nr:hypothetical protein [Candidatus Acidoferrales bacterium]
MPALLLCGITFIAYVNSFTLDLATDANVIVGADTRIRALTVENLRLIFGRDYWWPLPVDVLYRPITILSYLVNYAVLGSQTDPAGYHFTNFLLHAANVLLVFGLCRRIFDGTWPAFLAAAIWAVHPAGTESVTNVSGRADLLAALGVLAGLSLYVRAREWGGRRAAVGAAGIFSLTLFAVLSKENGAVLPGLMLVWDSLDFPALWREWRRRAPFYGATAAALGLAFWIRSEVLAARPWPLKAYLGNPLLMTDFWTARLTAVKVLGLQLWLMLCPLRLTFDRSYRQIPISTPGDPWAWCSLIAVIAILAAALIRYRRDRVLYFGIGFMAISILPTSNLLVLIGSVLAERFLYLPSIGFAIAAVALIFKVKDVRTARIILATVLVLFAGRTFARNFDWRNNFTLESADVDVSPDSFRTHDLLGRELYLRDPQANLDRAIREGEAAAGILSGLPSAYVLDDTIRHLGLYYAAKGDRLNAASPEQARAWYQKALEVLLRARDASLAIEQDFDRQQLAHGRPLAQRLGSVEVYQGLGAVYARLGRHKEAVEALRYGRGLKPEYLELYAVSSSQYLALGDAPMAMAIILEKVFLDGARPEALHFLQEAASKMPGGECALAQSGAAMTINYGCPAVRLQTCVALADLAGTFAEAREPARAQEQRERARTQFGCSVRP